MQIVFIADNAEFERVGATTLDDRRVTHVHLWVVNSGNVFFVRNGRVHSFGKFYVLHFLQKKRQHVLLFINCGNAIL